MADSPGASSRRHAFLAAAVVMACLALVTAYLVALPALGFDPASFNFRRFRPTLPAALLLMGPAALVMGVIALAQTRLHRIPFSRLGFGAPRWRTLLVGFAFGVVLAAVARGVRLLAATSIAVVETPSDADTAALALTLASAVVFLLLNSITEETLFRVYPLQKVAGDRAGLLVTLLAGALIFAAVHHQTQAFSIDAFFTRICMGLLLGTLYATTGSAWAPIGVHSGLNAVNAALSGNWAAGGFVRLDLSGPPWTAYVNAAVALAALGAVAGLWRGGKLQRLFPVPNGAEPSARAGND